MDVITIQNRHKLFSEIPIPCAVPRVLVLGKLFTSLERFPHCLKRVSFDHEYVWPYGKSLCYIIGDVGLPQEKIFYLNFTPPFTKKIILRVFWQHLPEKRTTKCNYKK